MQFLRTTCALLIVVLVSFATPASAQLRSFHLGDDIKIDDNMKAGDYSLSNTKIIGCHPADGQMSIISSGAVHRIRKGDSIAISMEIRSPRSVGNTPRGGNLFTAVRTTHVLKATAFSMDGCVATFQDVPATPKK